MLENNMQTLHPKYIYKKHYPQTNKMVGGIFVKTKSIPALRPQSELKSQASYWEKSNGSIKHVTNSEQLSGHGTYLQYKLSVSQMMKSLNA